MAGVIHAPQEHCAPHQLSVPMRARHLGHTSLEVPCAPPVEPIHGSCSAMKYDVHATPDCAVSCHFLLENCRPRSPSGTCGRISAVVKSGARHMRQWEAFALARGQGRGVGARAQRAV